MAICSCSSWSERPSNWSIGCGAEEEAEEDIVWDFKRRWRLKEKRDGVGAMEEGEVEDEREDETGGEEGERGDTPKRGKPVVWRGQQRLGTFVPYEGNLPPEL